jgi:hypothetical protein
VICRIAGASDLLAELSEYGQCATEMAELPVCGEAGQEIVRIACYASDLAELFPVCGVVCQ